MSERYPHTDEEIRAIAVGAVRPGHTDEEILRLSRQANRAVFYRYAAVASIVMLGVLGFFAGRISQRASSQADLAATKADATHNAQVAACEASKQPPDGIRFIIAQDKLRQAQQTHAYGIPKLAAKFGVSKKQLKQSLKQERALAHRLLTVDCTPQTGR